MSKTQKRKADEAAAVDGIFRAPTPVERMEREIRRTVAELAKREREGLQLYEPLPLQEAFHASRVKTRLARGSNRSGKTLMCAVELARAVLNCDPHEKYPAQGVVYIVGYDYDHHGTTVYPKLFKPGAFKCINDLETGVLRAFRPWIPEDKERSSEAVDAEPLIPDRFVESVSWYDKKEQIPSVIRLTTGWEIHFYSGDGRPPRGQAIDIGWLDEEIGTDGWYNEMVSRCADRDGKILWSAAPQSGTAQLYDLHEQAERTVRLPDRVVEEFHVRLADNPHLSAKAKADMAAAKTSASARITDIEGEFLEKTHRIYSEYSLSIHGVYDLPMIPIDWTRYAVVDPGHRVCAVLFAAVPPEDMRSKYGRLVLYDELYIERCNAAMFAKEMAGKNAGVYFHDFIIDTKGSQVTSAGEGKSIAQQYSEALTAVGVRCRIRGSGFAWGSSDVSAGIESVRSFLRYDPHIGRTGLTVLCEMTKHGQLVPRLSSFEYEIGRYRNKKIKDVVTDRPDESSANHLMACLRYLCAYDPKWAEPLPPPPPESPIWDEFQKKLARSGARQVGLRLDVKRD